MTKVPLIRHVNTGYDVTLRRTLQAMRSSPAFERPSLNVAEYRMPSLTLPELLIKNDNLLISIPKNRTIRADHKKWGDHAGWYGADCAQLDDILFSSKKMIMTRAITCLSYMLYSKIYNVGPVGVAVHVLDTHSFHPRFHLNMLSFALANLMAINNGSEITAFLAGGYVKMHEGKDSVTCWNRIYAHRALVLNAVDLFRKNNVMIDTVSVGPFHMNQRLILPSGGYYLDS